MGSGGEGLFSTLPGLYQSLPVLDLPFIFQHKTFLQSAEKEESNSVIQEMGSSVIPQNRHLSVSLTQKPNNNNKREGVFEARQARDVWGNRPISQGAVRIASLPSIPILGLTPRHYIQMRRSCSRCGSCEKNHVAASVCSLLYYQECVSRCVFQHPPVCRCAR